MIDRIEFVTLPDSGVAISFFYDTDCMDCFSIYEQDHIEQVMRLIDAQPEPEQILIAIRDLGRLSIH